ncbi:hypothetical protein CCACVL1_08621 [Corchorus capsularis]|uniref:ribonuclease P n=1 Tax=Corchorus capsularis TaxID=210143 RepID=A0A1R3IZL2_COCAP|nr:hypothetical protein CCACVL1_08621 [Corchorus capsularis]
MGPGSSSLRAKDENKGVKSQSSKTMNKSVAKKRSKKDKDNSPEIHLRVQLEMCSKRGDAMKAIQLYDKALREEGSSNQKKRDDEKDGSGSDREDNGIPATEDFKKYALRKGFEIYEKMCLDNVPMNEATLTAVARMGMAMGNGHMAFDMVKQMKQLGLNPRLRSYGPALSVFCSTGDVDKAFDVEKHMLEHGVQPEEPELEALLRVSVEAGKGDKVYYMLHKLRTSVRKVSPSTADIIVKWFESKAASRVGKRTMHRRLIKKAIENGGGGWHGQGWLGKGRWNVSRTTIGENALCKCCGEKLALIDLDPVETEKFAESVASIAIKREKHFSFQKFQKWLDYHGPFEAVIDAANVGLFSQRKFKSSKVNAVVNGIRQKLPSKKWPLIVLHNRRITGKMMDEPAVNKELIEKWQNADALYATPTGSNDDWYWLYAAIKFKCLIVTNDEMRDHTFQLLGNDFFPKWKERHHVHFSFSNSGPVFHMPPPFSVVIQESEKGHWHIPIASELDYDTERTWLCITRADSYVVKENLATIPEVSDLQPLDHNKECARSTTQTEVNTNSLPQNDGNHDQPKKPTEEIYKKIRVILSGASVSSDQCTILSKIEAAEILGNCNFALFLKGKKKKTMHITEIFSPPNKEHNSDDGFRFDKSLQELRDLRSQLHYAADYCETTFLNSADKKEVVENTKEYICKAVVTFVDHVGNVSANLNDCISKTDAFSEAELRINCLKQRILSCEQFAHKLALTRVQWNPVSPRHHRRYLSAPSLERSNEDSRVSIAPRPAKHIDKHEPLDTEGVPLFFFTCTEKPSLSKSPSLRSNCDEYSDSDSSSALARKQKTWAEERVV